MHAPNSLRLEREAVNTPNMPMDDREDEENGGFGKASRNNSPTPRRLNRQRTEKRAHHRLNHQN